MKKRWLIVITFICIIASFFYLLRAKPATTAKHSLPEAPKSVIKNVVLINIDSLRADHMGAYDYTKQTTPFLDSLFAGGVVFDNAVSPAYLTFQSDGAILSGLYPSQNNVMTWSTPINEKLLLLPGLLKLYGYSTAAFVSPSLWPYFGWNKQFDSYIVNRSGKNVEMSKFDVAQWMENTKVPFFLFWHIYDVHQPYIAPTPQFYSKDYSGPFANKNLDTKSEMQTPSTWFFWDTTTGTNSHDYSAPTFSYKINNEDVDYLKASYDSGIRFVDDQLRLFFESIQNKPYFKDTLFVISSEHGEDLKEHGYIFHRDLYDVNTKVPLAFIHPSLSPKRVSEAVSTIDIMNTVVPMLGIPAPANLEGQDDRYLFADNTSNLPRSIFSERPPFDEYSVRKGGWKYILRNPQKFSLDFSGKDVNNVFFSDILSSEGNAGDELYNLSVDPTEQTNLIGNGDVQETDLRDEALAFRDKMRQAREPNTNINPVKEGLLMPYP